jgi:ankyrin repeat protein
LVNHGCDVNIKDKYGQTCIYYAILGNKTTTVNELIKLGANLNEKDNKSITPHTWAKKHKKNEIAGLIAKRSLEQTDPKVRSENHMIEFKEYVLKTFINNDQGDTLSLLDLEKFFCKNTEIKELILSEECNPTDSFCIKAKKVIQELIIFTEERKLNIGIRAYFYLLIVKVVNLE